MARFWELVAEHRNERAPMRNAHICVESEFRQRHGVQRYSTYKSFSTVKSRSRNGHNLRRR